MKEGSIIRSGVAVALSVAAAACSPVIENASDFKARPIAETGSNRPAADGYYQGAVSAIDRRDYATALDYLQEARAKEPNSARVLNAFGVVYDKLGRFDLSARYYAQAAALDPGSPVVARNMAYSRLLQGMRDGPQVAANGAAMPGAPPVAAPTIPVVAETVPASAPLTGIVDAPAPNVLLAATHVAPAVAAPRQIAMTFDSPAPNFASANVELPDETLTQQPAVAQAHVAPRVTVPDAIAPAAAAPAVPSAVQVAFEDSRPAADAPAVQPLAVAPAALPNTPVQPAAAELPRISYAAVSFPKTAIALSDLSPVSDITQPAPAAAPVAHLRPVVASQPAVGVTMSSFTLAVLSHMDGAAFRGRAVAAAGPAVPVAAPAARKFMAVGRPLRIVNASGVTGSTAVIRRSLGALGWSISKTRPVMPAEVKLTTVVYPIANAPVARALARTLPFPVQMKPDTCNCRGIEVIVGTDFRNWKPAGRYVSNVWRTSFAALITNKGVQ